MNVTYAETRAWVVWLQVFTPRDLADSMGVPEQVVEDFLVGLTFNGTIEDTGDRINGRGPSEPIYRHVPLPPGPRVHETGPPPEVIAVLQMYGGFEILSPRGMPVRIRTERQMRRSLSTPGARQTHKMRELAYERQEEARKKRAAEQAAKSKDPKWLKEKQANRAKAIARERARLKQINEMGHDGPEQDKNL